MVVVEERWRLRKSGEEIRGGKVVETGKRLRRELAGRRARIWWMMSLGRF